MILSSTYGQIKGINLVGALDSREALVVLMRAWDVGFVVHHRQDHWCVLFLLHMQRGYLMNDVSRKQKVFPVNYIHTPGHHPEL